MAVNYNPKIAISGLVLYLDAANTKSYPGSGISWTDLSGNNNTGTLTNGPTFSSANGGSTVFDGVNDYIQLSTNLWNHDSGLPFTVSLFFKTSVSGGVLFGQQNSSSPGSAGSYVPAIYIGSDGLLRTSCFWSGSTSNLSATSSSVADGQWKNITVTFSSGIQTSYLNGVSYATLSKTQTTYSATYYYLLGAGTISGWPAVNGIYFNGSISTFSFYNRALTAAEVAQNYNALRGRFGI